MRLASCIISLLTSFGAYASDITVTMFPQQPNVFNSGLTVYPGTAQEQRIPAPWFKTTALVSNSGNEVITLHRATFTIYTSPASKYIVHQPIQPPMQIDAGRSLSIEPFYVGGLPATNISTYHVDMTIQGWTGPISQPGNPIAISTQFMTK